MTINLGEHTKPIMRTKPPGPKAKGLIKRDVKHFAPCYARPYALVAERGSGVWIEDIDGNVFLDCTAGIAVTATGHSHPDVVAAISEQASKLIHMSGTDFMYKIQVDLVERLCKLVPGKQRFMGYLCNSGAESVEAAMKLARLASGRPRLIAFAGGFHGRTMGALSLTSSKAVQREGYFPLVPGVTHIPYPDKYRPPFHCDPKRVGDEVLYYLEETVLKKIAPPSEVAAIVFEPLQGEGGYIVPPKDFFKRLRKICDRHGILMVCDEVQAGMGRTGKMFGFEHLGIEPDIICMAKGLASGLPLGATLARADLMKTWGPGRQGTTFGGNPVACAAAMKTLDLVQSKYMRNAHTVGAYMMTELKKIMRKSKYIGDVRGRGLMLAVDCVKDKKSHAYNPEYAQRIVQRCFEKGLLLLLCGSSSVRFSPPLVLTKAQASVALKIFASVL